MPLRCLHCEIICHTTTSIMIIVALSLVSAAPLVVWELARFFVDSRLRPRALDLFGFEACGMEGIEVSKLTAH